MRVAQADAALVAERLVRLMGGAAARTREGEGLAAALAEPCPVPVLCVAGRTEHDRTLDGLVRRPAAPIGRPGGHAACARRPSSSSTVIRRRSVRMHPSSRRVCSAFATASREEPVHPASSSCEIGA